MNSTSATTPERPTEAGGDGVIAAKPAASTVDAANDGTKASDLETMLLVAFLLLVFVFLIGLLFSLWPDARRNDAARVFGLLPVTIEYEARLSLLVIFAGALGAYVHVATSAADFIGNRRLMRQWVYWYILRLPIGATLAFLLYLIIRDPSEQPRPSLPYKVVGTAALAGMFSKQAMNKLRELFDTLFKSSTEGKLKDALKGNAPLLKAVLPEQLPPSGGTLRLLGRSFKQSTRVTLDGKEVASTYVDENELHVDLTAEQVGPRRSLKVRVLAPEAIERESGAVVSIAEQEAKP
jgi:hypothetical protein